MLCAGIGGEDSWRPVWRQIESLDLGVHVEWRDVGEEVASSSSLEETFEGAFRKAVIEQIDAPFADVGTRPVWRIVVLNPVPRTEGGVERWRSNSNWIEVLFCFSHVVGDGLAGKIFHETLQRNLRASTIDNNNTDDPLPLKGDILQLPRFTKSTFTPSPQDLLTYTMSPTWALATLWRELIPPFLTKPERSWIPTRTNTNIKEAQPPTRWRLFHVDAARTSRILAACRRHGTTLTGLLQALALVAFAARVSPELADEFSSETYINMRRFMKSGESKIELEKTILSAIMVLNHKFDRSLVTRLRQLLAAESKGRDVDESTSTATPGGGQEEGEEIDKEEDELERAIWDVAADARARIVDRIERGTRDVENSLMGFVPDARAYYEQQLLKPQTTIWGVANIGTIRPLPAPDSGGQGGLREGRDGDEEDDEDAWKIERCVFPQTAFRGGDVFDMSVAGVQGGPVSVCFLWEAGILSDEMAEGVAADIEARIDRIAG